ncbi:MAG: TauD/TfdA family dioxygenase [Pseudomonadota bacterium]|nr:TauD/TfdA family dioxygenase [Pseudomonadota bacterium]
MKYADITPTFGAELEQGTQLAEISDDDVIALKQLAAERGVVVARNQIMDVHSQARFGRRLGPIMDSPKKIPDVPEGLILIQAGAKSKTVAGQQWHSDVSSEAIPPGLSMLRMEVVPASGGDTLYADMYRAFELLSPAMQNFLKQLTARHDPKGHYLYLSGAKKLDELPSNNHPVVRTHPLTGRDALYVNSGFVGRINELSSLESKRLLEMLYDHIAYSVDIQCRVNWQPNTVVFWDNRVVQHHATFDYYPEVRKGYRVTVVGEAPFLTA